MDSAFAPKATGRRSVSGAVVMCAGGAVSFLSRTQKSVTLSSCDAEYVAMVDGLKEAIFSCAISGVIFPDECVGCTVVNEDNMDGGALYYGNNPATTPNSKHIDIRHHFIRQRVARKEVRDSTCSVGFAAR